MNFILLASNNLEEKYKETQLSKLFYDMIDQYRNIYENASLFPQNRLHPDEYAHLLKSEINFEVRDNVADYILDSDKNNSNWSKQNKKFLNYHKSLTPATFFNSISIDHYIAAKTQLHKLSKVRVLDVGGGTGHFLCSFFRNPASLEYFLVDPNVREIHDQFVRMYPALLELKMRHIKAYAEQIPLIDECIDLVVSSSAIDHYKDYKLFIKESYRCLKSGGKILISSHLKKAKSKHKKTWSISAFFEYLAKSFHRIRNRVAINDHVLEFSDTEQIEDVLKAAGFIINQSEIFKNYFYIVARKE